MLCSRRKQRGASLPTEKRFCSQRHKSLVSGKRRVETYLVLNLGKKIDPLSCLLNFLCCSIHGAHAQPSFIFSTNFRCHRHSLIEEIVDDHPPGRVVKTEIVNGTSTNARKVIRKYAAMTPASSYSYVAIVA